MLRSALVFIACFLASGVMAQTSGGVPLSPQSVSQGAGTANPGSGQIWGTAEVGTGNLLGGVTPNGGTGATCSTASTSTGCIAKNAAGNLFRAQATAPSAPSAQQYLVCVNSATVPTSGAAITPVSWGVFNLATTAGSTAQIYWGPGPPDPYSAGISCVVSQSLTTYTPGTASIISVSVR